MGNGGNAMAGRRKEPVNLVLAKGKKHLTKEEIEQRKAGEIKPIIDGISPPDYLLKDQKEEFIKTADQLKKLKIMGETDVDTLARYVVANSLYIKTVKKIRKPSVINDPAEFDFYTRILDKYFKMCRNCANDLGLTITSRTKLVVPEPPKPKSNKFDKFKKGPNDD